MRKAIIFSPLLFVSSLKIYNPWQEWLQVMIIFVYVVYEAPAFWELKKLVLPRKIFYYTLNTWGLIPGVFLGIVGRKPS